MQFLVTVPIAIVLADACYMYLVMILKIYLFGDSFTNVTESQKTVPNHT